MSRIPLLYLIAFFVPTTVMVPLATLGPAAIFAIPGLVVCAWLLWTRRRTLANQTPGLIGFAGRTAALAMLPGLAFAIYATVRFLVTA